MIGKRFPVAWPFHMADRFTYNIVHVCVTRNHGSQPLSMITSTNDSQLPTLSNDSTN